jgi:hypothetical protein
MRHHNMAKEKQALLFENKKGAEKTLLILDRDH